MLIDALEKKGKNYIVNKLKLLKVVLANAQKMVTVRSIMLSRRLEFRIWSIMYTRGTRDFILMMGSLRERQVVLTFAVLTNESVHPNVS